MAKSAPKKNQNKTKKTNKKVCSSKSKKRSAKSSIIVKKRCERQYSKENIVQALDAINKGQSYRMAADTFKVPKTTLYRILKGESSIEFKKKGPRSILSEEDEADLVQWILYCASVGHPVGKRKLFLYVQKYVESKKMKNPFTNNKPGKHWYQAFMTRHPNLSLRISQSLTCARSEVEEKDIRQWFARVKKSHEKKELLNIGPERIFNLDETAFQIVPPDSHVLAEKGARTVYRTVNTEKTSMTVLFTASAVGAVLPPVLLFNLKYPPKKITIEKIPKTWGVGNTDKGWMTSESFFKFIKIFFINGWLITILPFQSFYMPISIAHTLPLKY